jgi:Bacterial regulatory proteins, tetR family
VAVDCFWQRGYEATSMRDLAVSMGVSAPSLYKCSGINRLFLPALWNGISIAARATELLGSPSQEGKEVR